MVAVANLQRIVAAEAVDDNGAGGDETCPETVAMFLVLALLIVTVIEPVALAGVIVMMSAAAVPLKV